MDSKTREGLQKRVEEGDLKAMEQLADHYFYETNKQRLSEEAFIKIRGWYKHLAKAGNAHAMMVLGAMYYEGVNMAQDYTKARIWYEKAAAAGDVWAINNLGYCYYYGREIPVDYQRAYGYFERAAALSNHCGMYKLGDMYYHGQYVKQDFEAAFDWYRRGIDCIDETCPEYPNIGARIGRCLLNGQGVAQNFLEAHYWLTLSERGCYGFLMKGDAFAHLSLPGIKADLKKVRYYLEQAVADTKSVVQYN